MQELKQILEELGIPIAYSHFNTTITPPVIAYYRNSTANFGADNMVYQKIEQYYVELYTKYKDTAMEHRLERIFDEHEIYYNVESESYIDTEQMYQIIYTIDIDETNKDIETEAEVYIAAEGNINQ